jgi:hypothetical protein
MAERSQSHDFYICAGPCGHAVGGLGSIRSHVRNEVLVRKVGEIRRARGVDRARHARCFEGLQSPSRRVTPLMLTNSTHGDEFKALANENSSRKAESGLSRVAHVAYALRP